MYMAMVFVRVMRMRVTQRLVSMPVRVRLAPRIRFVPMTVMFVVDMTVLVSQERM
jgi:hypothetical protein